MPAADLFDLTVAQRDIWLEQLSQSSSPLYNIGAYVALEGQVDRTRLAQALDHLASLHDALRTTWVQDGGLAQQRFATQLPVKLMWEDLQAEAHPADAALNLLDAWMRSPIALEQGPLWEARLIRLSPHEHLLALRAHHLVLDGWGVDQWFKQLADLYHKLEDHQPLPASAPSYCAYIEDDARYQASARYQRDRDYWLARLAQLPDPLLRPNPSALSLEGSPSHADDLAVAPDLMRNLRALANTLDVSPLPVLLAALHVCVCRTWQRDQWMVGLPVRNRANAQFKATLGLFTQVSPLRMDFGRNLSFAGLIQAIAATLKQDFRHQRYPLSALKRDLAAQHEGRTQLFELLVSFEEDTNALRIGDAAGATVMICNGHEPSPLSIHLRCNTHAGTARLHLVHSRAWFSDEQAEAIGARLLHVLEQGLAQPQALVSAFDMLTAPEHQRLKAWNLTALPATDTAPCLIQQRIELQARTRPQALAACFGDQTLSYGELDHRASALAQHLASLGVGPERRVAVVAQRGLETLVGLLAVLKAGGAYVPIDPAHPAERIAYLLQDSAPHVVLTLSRFAPRLPKHGRPQIELDNPSWPTKPVASFSFAPQTSTDLVYVIYTSGSTGQPKGVMVEQRMLANLVDWHCTQFALGPGRHQSSVAGFGFDAMAWEVWPALCSGATLHLAPVREGAEDVHALLAWWRAQPLHVSFLPTPIAELALAQGMPHPTLETLLVGGDRLRRLGPALTYKVINNYGPTEATVVATSGQVLPGGPLHIGVPIANTQVYVLDGQGQLLPPGAAGELYIGGQGVARGYLNQPQLSAERFVRDPFSSAPGARLYRTGDWVRWLPDGTLEYLGRNDDQVKIRGMRVELAEIEAALSRHPAVSDGVVMLCEGQLHAWFTAPYPVIPRALHDHLRDSLPVALLPVAYMQVAHWPLTANGKLDRRALPPATDTAMVRHEHEPPEGEMEQRLAALWSQLLHIERIGRYDHFFELGGHSLLAVQLIEGMRQQGLQVDVQVLFGQSTLAAVAASTRATECVQTPAPCIASGCQRIEPGMLPLATLGQAALDRIVARVPGGAANVQEIYPLAPLQQGLLYHHLTDTVDPYQQQAVFSFATEQQMHSFAAALQHVVERHDILRTSLAWEGLETPHQVVWRHARLPVERWQGPEGQWREHYHPSRRPLSLDKAPMLALVCMDAPEQGRWLALLRFHHLVNDAVSLQVLLGELEAWMAGQGAQLPAPVPYRDYVALTNRAERQAAHRAFFTEQLAGLEPQQPLAGWGGAALDQADLENASHDLPAATVAGLRSLARAHGASLASLLHLAWAHALGSLGGRDQVVVGTVLLGRSMAGTGADRALGMFINSLPLRIDLNGCTPAQALADTHARLAALLAHEDAPLILAQQCSGLPAGSALFDSLVNYRQGAVPLGEVMPGVALVEASEVTSHGLVLTVDDPGDCLQLAVRAPGDCLQLAVRAPRALGAQRMLDYLDTALEQIGQALSAPASGMLQQLCPVPARELALMLEYFNATEDPTSPVHHTLPALFEAQVQRTPWAIALQADGQSLDYQTLNEQANRLAHYLIGLGVTPDSRVAVCIERGVSLMIALLGVLKAGGAYVPLDPEYPEERLRFMLQDCDPVTVLVHGATAGLFAPLQQPTLNLDRCDVTERPSTDPQVPGLGPQHLAYVMYTSGSTGTPKGVMIEHRGLCNLMHWGSQIRAPRAGDALLQRAPCTFDGSVWELFWPLTAGLRLVLARPGGHRDPGYLVELIKAQHVSIVKFVPALLQQFLDQPGVQGCTRLTDIFCGGGDLTPALLQSLRERLPWVCVHNVYGPTEATVDSTAWSLPAHAPLPVQAPPIGRPIPNTRVYVLDEHDRPVPLGGVGQLHIGGVGVARGYLGLPELQAERFIPSRFVDGDRLYRTGDLVRYREDGDLEFMGRNDFQVKLRGLRVELGEIEASLTAHPAVAQAVVLMREERLVAYFTLCDDQPAPALEALRGHLLACMPEYMVPQAFVRLAQLPLSANGKLDRRALPEPGADAVISRAYRAPEGELEAAMAAIWAELLKIEQVGRDDNFFELGGHSLLAVSLVARLRQAGLHVDARALFTQPTLSGLAASTQAQPEQAVIAPTTIPSLGKRRRL